MDKEKTLLKLKQEIKEVQEKCGVDPLELAGVVRCRNCKYNDSPDCPFDTYMFDRTQDTFCSYGERREQDA